ncbi:MAG: 2-dehydropantoate 2-reductase [Vicinamibacterales bacterium]
MSRVETRLPHVGVMGGGAVGCFFGSMLARAGAAVTLVGRAAHVDAINRDGLIVDSVNGAARVPMRASTDVDELATVDVVLVAVKTPDTESAADALAGVLAPHALIVSLQNGVDNAWRIHARIANAVVPSVVYVSTEMTGPGVLKHNGGGRLIIGEPLTSSAGASAARAAVGALADAFIQAGVPCDRSDDIRVDLWTKLATNCAYNAISALTQLRYGRVADDAGARDVMRMVTDEILAVAAAEGVPIEADAVRESVRRIAESMPAALASTAQDLLLGRRTEIDDLNGFVVRRGGAHGVSTPVNRTLQALVKLAERAGHKPS